MENNVANITRSGKHYKPSFLEKDHPGRDIREGSKPTEPKGKEEKEEEDQVLTQLKKTQAYVSIKENSSLCLGMGLAYGFLQAS